ncbi:GNAT family N-acetyltransferase [Noviherbaspirillum pedocola]|uniref:GNAT family N-acetyltransferase n=1 Tax=Noviherbaspirillum pedocola TaxID=2801341 RepID=A0A934SWV3_9BURK|nr:GNAT family N-acetyltransferase [Noviherbaspirillum pedocola]MBK4734174.1 GNAT family N-acetyltransferase [Noviherbaspirillum pedocola]
MPAHIRPYRDADRDAVIAAFRSNVPEHFPASEEPWLVSALEEPDGPFFVIEDEGEIVGCGGYELSDFYNLGTLVFGLLRADRHRTGLGRMLLLHRLLAMAEDPMRPRYVTIDTHPHVAGFYLRHGFHEMARWSGGYRSGRDRVDLRIELTDAEVERLKAMRDAG